MDEIKENFLAIEDKLNLFDRKIKGVYFWEQIRNNVSRNIVKDLGNYNNPHAEMKKNVKNWTKKLFLSFRNLFVKNPFFSSQKDIIFWGFSRRKLQKNGKWWDIYCDHIINNLERSYLYLESFYLGNHINPAETENIAYLDFVHALSNILRKILSPIFHFSEEEKKLIKKIEEEFYNFFGIKVNIKYLVKKIILDNKIKIPLYKLLLKKIKPKLTVVVFINQKTRFIKACHDLNIPVVHIGGGAITKYNFNYSKKRKIFPDYLFVFGNFWKDLTEFPIDKDRIFSVGHPYLEEEFKKYAKLEKKNQIIFLSQRPIGIKFSKLAVELSKIIPDCYKIVYKLHPEEFPTWKKEYPWLLNSPDIRIIEESPCLYELFAESKAEVSVFSTSTYEGLYFGLKSYVANWPLSQNIFPLIEGGYSELFSSVEELKEKIVKDGPDFNQSFNRNYFFEDNSLNKINKKIERIIRKDFY